MTNPYKSLPRSAFWSAAVARAAPDRFADLYRRKFEIQKSDRIVTAGSCFAQHIANRLAASGFTYMDYEPAPDRFPAARRPDFNFGVYSARYCNIYTVRQLLQLHERVYGARVPVEDRWISDAGVHDPFRPAVEPVPFRDETDFEMSRRTHFKAVRRVFEESDLFVFTLGLTEAWEDIRDGSVYPVCPGTAAGKFDAAKYRFRNFTHAEILEDFRALEARVRERNPSVRFLLTVSPVPLVATASGEHVLPATIYSKSVLRAVAGQLSLESEMIDYFPSYEIVAGHPSKGMHFHDDLRQVRSAGVDYVMSHFFAAHAPDLVPPRHDEIAPVSAAPQEYEPDVICEEMYLEQQR